MSQPALRASRSWVTLEPKNSGASSAGSQIATGAALAFTHFMMPWMGSRGSCRCLTLPSGGTRLGPAATSPCNYAQQERTRSKHRSIKMLGLSD